MNTKKLFKWEYWPTSMFYIPNIPFALYHAIKAKNLAFYTAVNPSIENSGIGTESKYKTLQLIPRIYLPKTVFHKSGTNINAALKKVEELNIEFPLIAIPDIGFRGLLVNKIYSKEALKSYLKKYTIDIIIQEFLTEQNECGIFYHRLPGAKKGKITSITLKDFLHVIGDGKSSLEILINNNIRVKKYISFIKNNSSISLKTIPKKDEKVILSDIGNHCKGTQFINGNHLISEKLEETINNLNQQIEGWFYGRLDVKYASFEELEKGKFKVLELNGILAEPTHMYDTSQYNYLSALKEIRTHWKSLYKIARINHDTKQVPYRSTIGLLKDVNRLKKYTKSIAKLHKKA
jgi:hypothetical protein